MAMTNEKIKQAFEDCLSYFCDEEGDHPPALRDETEGSACIDDEGDYEKATIQHLVHVVETGMVIVEEAEDFLKKSDEDVVNADEYYEKYKARREKAMRWLGFLQGALWMGLGVDLKDLKRMNMPDENTEAKAT